MIFRRIISFVAAAAIAFSALSITSFAADYKLTKFSVKEETKPVSNPHKGWVQYAYSADNFEEYAVGIKNNPTWQFTDTVYTRFNWCNIETSKGKYDWSAIDKYIELCKKYNKRFAFGIIPSDSGCDSKDGLVPQYVYDEGCKYDMAKTNSFYNKSGIQRTPVWSDPKYIEAALNLAKAVAERYDGNEYVEFIDVRMFGNWGEWHTYGLEGSTMPSDKIMMNSLDKWAEYFKKTQLVMPVNGDKPTDVTQYAVDLGISLRRDGTIALKDSELALLIAVEKNLPAVGEFCYDYNYMVKNDMWEAERLRTVVNNGKLTFYALGASVYDGLDMYNANHEIIDELQNRLGYNFVVTNAYLKNYGKKAAFEFTVENKGVASTSFPFTIKAAYTDQNGNVLSEINDNFSFEIGEFESGASKKFKIDLETENVPKGAFLAIGIFENGQDMTPTVKFGNKNTKDNNYLVLGKIK